MAAELNIANYIVQAKTLKKEDERALFTLNLLMGFFVGLLGFFVAPVVARIYNSPDVVLPLRLLALSFIVRSFGILPDAMLRRDLAFKTLGLMNLSAGISRGLLQLLLAILGYGYWALIIGMLYRDLFVTLWVIVARGIPRSLHWDTAIVRSVVRYGLPATGSSLCWVIFTTADYAVVGTFFDMETLGYYAMAFYLTDLPMSKINQIIRPVLIPYFSKVREDLPQLRESFLAVARACSLIFFPLLLGLSIVAPEAVPIVLGDKWIALIVPLQVLCIVSLLRAFTDSVSPVFLALGKPEKNFIIHASTAAVMPITFYLLAKSAGMVGVYSAWLFVYPIISFLAVIILRDVIGISPRAFILNHAASFTSALGMALITVAVRFVLLSKLPPVPLLIIEVVVGAFVYLSLLALLFRAQSVRAFSMLRQARTSSPSVEIP